MSPRRPRPLLARDARPRPRRHGHGSTNRMRPRFASSQLVRVETRIAELQRAYAEAATDSARLVFGTMLQRMGELQLTNAEIAEALASGDPARSTLAMTTLLAEFRRMARPVPADSAAAFVNRLIAATVDSGPLWRS